MRTDSEIDVIVLVKQAQRGDSSAMSMLSEQVAKKLLPYIQGLTLNYDLSEDILQETLLELVKSLNKVKNPESFWCWIYRQALGKAQHHFRGRRRQKSIVLRVATGILGQATHDSLSGLNYAMRKELSDVVLKAMGALKLEYRNVLILRCYENLSYSEIAQTMNCKEIYARVLFLRAKRSLRKQLGYGGFGKEYLLAALVLFRILTKPSEATSTTALVTANVLQIDAFAAVISLLASKFGLLITSLVTIFTVYATTQTVLYGIGALILSLYVLFCLWLATLYSR
jgi:RNA polymerase sigma-70 factor (ECF subfamily)